jgi:hypothetical protein
LFASGGIEKFEKSDAQPETFGGRSVFELTYATYEGGAAQRGE